jgi:predicted DNA-binding antitoxin AbrB/MazE fold protein
MSIMVEGIYRSGVIKLKTAVEAPNNSEVLVLFKNRSKTDKEKFIKSAGKWKNIDMNIFNGILKSRKDLRKREFEL